MDDVRNDRLVNLSLVLLESEIQEHPGSSSVMQKHLVENGLLPKELESVVFFGDHPVWDEAFVDLVPVHFFFVRFLPLHHFHLVFSHPEFVALE